MLQYLEQRIKTLAIDTSIVAGSTPVPFFGDFFNSKVATLGINPSKNEFHHKGKELLDGERRFETLKSLGAKELNQLSGTQVQKVIDSCVNYFGANPYKRWFNQLENNILNRFSVSFFEGTACHLDVVQWSTDPVWRHLDLGVQEAFLKTDLAFLAQQLQESKIETLLINGKGATDVFRKYFSPKKLDFDQLLVDTKTCTTESFELVFPNKKIKVYAWSNNLQSTRGLTNKMKGEIGNWIEQH